MIELLINGVALGNLERKIQEYSRVHRRDDFLERGDNFFCSNMMELLAEFSVDFLAIVRRFETQSRQDGDFEMLDEHVMQLLNRHLLHRNAAKGERLVHLGLDGSGFLDGLLPFVRLVLGFSAAQRLNMRGSLVGLLWRSDTITSWCNVGHSKILKLCGLVTAQDLGIFAEMHTTVVFVSTIRNGVPHTRNRLNIRKGRDKRVRTMDRTSIDGYHDRIPSMGVPMEES